MHPGPAGPCVDTPPRAGEECRRCRCRPRPARRGGRRRDAVGVTGAQCQERACVFKQACLCWLLVEIGAVVAYVKRLKTLVGHAVISRVRPRPRGGRRGRRTWSDGGAFFRRRRPLRRRRRVGDAGATRPVDQRLPVVVELVVVDHQRAGQGVQEPLRGLIVAHQDLDPAVVRVVRIAADEEIVGAVVIVVGSDLDSLEVGKPRPVRKRKSRVRHRPRLDRKPLVGQVTQVDLVRGRGGGPRPAEGPPVRQVPVGAVGAHLVMDAVCLELERDVLLDCGRVCELERDELASRTQQAFPRGVVEVEIGRYGGARPVPRPEDFQLDPAAVDAAGPQVVVGAVLGTETDILDSAGSDHPGRLAQRVGQGGREGDVGHDAVGVDAVRAANDFVGGTLPECPGLAVGRQDLDGETVDGHRPRPVLGAGPDDQVVIAPGVDPDQVGQLGVGQCVSALVGGRELPVGVRLVGAGRPERPRRQRRVGRDDVINAAGDVRPRGVQLAGDQAFLHCRAGAPQEDDALVVRRRNRRAEPVNLDLDPRDLPRQARHQDPPRRGDAAAVCPAEHIAVYHIKLVVLEDGDGRRPGGRGRVVRRVVVEPQVHDGLGAQRAIPAVHEGVFADPALKAVNPAVVRERGFVEKDDRHRDVSAPEPVGHRAAGPAGDGLDKPVEAVGVEYPERVGGGVGQLERVGSVGHQLGAGRCDDIPGGVVVGELKVRAAHPVGVRRHANPDGGRQTGGGERAGGRGRRPSRRGRCRGAGSGSRGCGRCRRGRSRRRRGRGGDRGRRAAGADHPVGGGRGVVNQGDAAEGEDRVVVRVERQDLGVGARRPRVVLDQDGIGVGDVQQIDGRPVLSRLHPVNLVGGDGRIDPEDFLAEPGHLVALVARQDGSV